MDTFNPNWFNLTCFKESLETDKETMRERKPAKISRMYTILILTTGGRERESASERASVIWYTVGGVGVDSIDLSGHVVLCTRLYKSS